MKTVHHDLIKRRAYEIWEASGYPHGRDTEHWAQAERELLSAGPAAAPKKGVAAKAAKAVTKTKSASAVKAMPPAKRSSKASPPAKR